MSFFSCQNNLCGKSSNSESNQELNELHFYLTSPYIWLSKLIGQKFEWIFKKEMLHHTCFLFPYPPSRMDVVRVGKVGHNCREVLRWRRSRDPLLLLFPRINHYCSRPRILQKKLFLFWPRLCQRQLLLRLSPVRTVFLPPKLDFCQPNIYWIEKNQGDFPHISSYILSSLLKFIYLCSEIMTYMWGT